ncbi:hypothetical protein [Maribacter arcticus]|uniref:hypothetical protein n=1 Tax=Maribacter arcticus TaxID=561365 RepID=UPI0030025940
MEHLKNEISKIAYYISKQISNEKMAFDYEKNKIEEKRLNVIKRFDELEKSWTDSLAKMKEQDNITITTAIHEGRCEAIQIAKRIINEGLNAL